MDHLTPEIPSDDVLRDWLIGQDPEAARAVSAWAAGHASREAWLVELRAGYDTTRPLAESIDVEAGLARFNQQRRQDAVVANGVPRQRSSTRAGLRRVFPFATVTAALVIAVVAITQWSGSSASESRDDNPIAYTTRKAQRAELRLPDGTRVMMNAASRIEISRDFETRRRVVRLTGEAYFDVAQHAAAPFIVEAGGTRTTVLGTVFGVRAYESSDVRVAVRSGRVQVTTKEKTAILQARDIARMTDRGALRVTAGNDLEPALAFAEGHLTLTRVPLKVAAAELERWYDVDIRFADPAIGDWPLTAVLSGSVDDLVKLLRDVFNTSVVRDGRTITLYPR